MIKNIKYIKLLKRISAVFCLAFVLMLTVSISPNYKVYALDNYDNCTTFYLWGDSSIEVKYQEYGEPYESVYSIPFTRLNSSNILGNSYKVYYGDYSTTFKYLSPPFEQEAYYSAFELNSQNFFIPVDSIHEIFGNNIDSNFILGEYLGQDVVVRVSIGYLNTDSRVEYYYQSFTASSTNSEILLNDLVQNFNKNSFKKFGHLGINYGLVVDFKLIVETAFWVEDVDTLWDLNLVMYDYTDIGSYADYLTMQRQLMNDFIDSYHEETSYFKDIARSVNDFLQIQILPNMRFIDILALALTIPLTVWLLKSWLGG